MPNKSKKVYVTLSADILHEGHLNILKIGSKYGKVTVGLLTDKAICSYKRIPHLDFEQRKKIVSKLKYVDDIVPQNSLDHTYNLKQYKPDFVVHGDDWKKGILKNTRRQVVKILKKWNGKLIEPKYTHNFSKKKFAQKVLEVGTTPDIRRLKLKRLINSKNFIRILETHSPLAGLIVENTSLINNNKFKEFDGMWSSSLTDSALRGMPDNQSVDYSTRTNALIDIFNVTTKPLIFDIDNGGRVEHLKYVVRKLEATGVSAIIMEDKIGLKKNSLFENQEKTKQDSITSFCKKIKIAKKSSLTDDFLIIARVESLILGKSVQDALKRAEKYSKAGADCIMIHSKNKNPNEIFKFSKIFSKSKFFKPLVAVPSTYSKTYEKKLYENNFKIVIYANHLLRASYVSMKDAAEKILKYERSFEIEKKIYPIKKIINLVN